MIISNEQKINWSSLYLKNAKNYFICQFITNAYFEFIAMNPIKEKSSETILMISQYKQDILSNY